MRNLAFAITLLFVLTGQAAPIRPADDAQVIERLPAVARVSKASDPASALRDAQALLQAGREAGDPRLAGRALARLSPWASDPRAPLDIQIKLADIEQHLHRFDSATARLKTVVQRDPRQAQAWLTLATLHRVQGRYGESDAACDAVAALRVQPYAQACKAENLGLRGEFDAARKTLQDLLASPVQPSVRSWLWTSLAELEQRAGRPREADAAWQRALQSGPDHYASLAGADFLLDNQRPGEAFQRLRNEPRSDAVLLRLAIAARQAGLPEAATLTSELRDRFTQAALRTEPGGHERERAMMALHIDGDAPTALAAARLNARSQREPLDLLLLARCAIAAGDRQALAEARQLARQMGLRDARLDSL